MQLPVYLITGFLESGKTYFIQQLLEDPEFVNGERTLVLVCEEGIEEYQPERFAGKNIFLVNIEEEGQLQADYLKKLQLEYKVSRVIVEYNGMWMLDSLFRGSPEDWDLAQTFTFVDSRTFISYNTNMRQLVFDKLQIGDSIIFRHFDESFDKMEFHKIVRVASRRSQIIYEYSDDVVELDDIPDPLPYDIEKDEIEIKDLDFAEFYRDINEEQDKYEGKIMHIRARAVTGGGLTEDEFVFGRHVMTCCEEDIQFCGLVAHLEDAEATLEHGEWYKFTAKITNEYNPMYGDIGPVFYCTEIKKAAPAVPEVATF